MRLILLFYILLFPLYLQAQTNNNFAALLLSFHGKGTVVQDGFTSEIELPQSYKINDTLLLSEGKASLLLASGNEVRLSAGDKYIVPAVAPKDMIAPVDPSLFGDYEIQTQSNSAFTIRGNDAKLHIYPLSSKLIDPAEAILFWKIKDAKDVSISFSVIQLSSDEKIVDVNVAEDDYLSLDNIEFEKGEEYYWLFSIENTDMEEMGAITVLDNAEINELPEFKLDKKADYLKAYNYYMKNEFYFHAYEIIVEAQDRYPEANLFSYLHNRLRFFN